MNMIMKHLYDKNIYKVVGNVLKLSKLLKVEIGTDKQFREFIVTLFTYIFNAIKLDVNKMKPISEKIIEKEGASMITTADILRKEGRKQGKYDNSVNEGFLNALKNLEFHNC